MAREIKCGRCSKYLGEIRDAKLMKNMSHLCDDCMTCFRALELAKNTGNKTPDPMNDIFGDLFGNKKWGK